MKTKFRNTRIKTLSIAVSLITIFAFSMLAPLTLAQVGIPQPVKTAGYANVAPQLVGVGQAATVNLWVFPTPQTYSQRPYFAGYNGLIVTFTKPDGTKDSFAPIDGTGQYAPGQTESIGNIYFFYEPDIAGNWSVSFTMPEQNITDSSGTVIYQACTSDTAYFTVQTDPVNAGLLNGYPWSQLPNENTYWSYPINSNNREWSQISGDWLLNGVQQFGMITSSTVNYWQPYGSGPNTGHIVWDRPHSTGGLIGGDYGSISYSTACEKGAVVMAGKVFVNVPSNLGGFASPIGQFQCIDLTTGQLVYTAPGTISCGIHLPGDAHAQSFFDPSVVLASSFGSTPAAYLFGASGRTWNYYDPYTGVIMRSIVNASTSGYQLVDGTTLAYGISGTNLFCWNMSRVVNNNWPTGIEWTRPLMEGASRILGISNDQSTIVLTSGLAGTSQRDFGFSTKDGASTWNLTLSYSVGVTFSLYGSNVNDFIVFNPVDSTFHCYSMLTGAELWTSSSFANSRWSTEYTVYASETNDNDNLYIMSPDGIIRALSLKTGDLIWESTPIASTEYINNVAPYYVGMVMVGGNIYAYAGYSSIYEIDPIPRHAMLVCVNTTTGDISYTLNGGVYPYAAANGYIVGLGRYDGNLYCIGKGQTSTSVMIQNDVVTNHATALIKGNVLDQSPAQPDTPAVADSSMSEWMDYIHMQNATLQNNPPKPEGVPVTLTAVDPNGNTITIGTATTDSAGNYGINFVPTIDGMYTIIADFEGTDSYWPSSSETKLTVTEAPAATSSAPVQTATDYTLPIVGTGIATILAVAIATVLLLRKRP